MHVLVTGSQGYIGSVLAPMLVAHGHEVLGLDSDLYGRCTYGDSMPKTDFVRKDIRDVVARDLSGFDAVIHLAALSNDPLGDLNPQLTFEINHAASVRLAEMAKAAGVSRFLFSSSCSIYGKAGDEAIDEHGELKPVTPYGLSKQYVERDLRILADSRFSPTFLRNATAYGASPRMRFDLVLNNLTAWAYTTGRVYLKSDGTPWRPIVHVEDISRAFIAVLNAPRETVHNESFNVGINTENYRIRELASIVGDTVPGARVDFAPDAGPDLRCYRVDFRKYQKAFPEAPLLWDARRGTDQIYGLYKRFGLAREEFEGPKYMRIAHVKALMAAGELGDDLRWR